MEVPPIVAEEPLQTMLALPGVGVGNAFTVILTESFLAQPVEVRVAVNLYVVVVVGLTVALEEVELNPLGFEDQL